MVSAVTPRRFRKWTLNLSHIALQIVIWAGVHLSNRKPANQNDAAPRLRLHHQKRPAPDREESDRMLTQQDHRRKAALHWRCSRAVSHCYHMDRFGKLLGVSSLRANVTFESTFRDQTENEPTRNRYSDRLELLTPDPQLTNCKFFTCYQ